MKKKFTCLFIFLSFAFSNVSAQVFPTFYLQQKGSPDTLINIVVMGDGYTSGEQSKFETDAISFRDYFFSKTPYKQYSDYFNVIGIKVVSAESGATHPQTSSDGECKSQPISSASTYFGVNFDYGGIHRLAVPTKTSDVVNVLAANFPKYDIVVILSNTTYYGGSGGTFATSTLHSTANLISLHEIGHSFGLLADEYWAGDIYAREQPNMTANSNVATVKWKNWLNAGDNSPYNTTVGVYPYGASDNSANWYKPANYCMMQYLADYLPFCPVCVQNIIERIHSYSNPILKYTPTVLDINSTDAKINFKLTELLKPVPNTLLINWQLDGNPLGDYNADSVVITQSELADGPHQLRVTVEDTTSLLRVDNHKTVHSNNVVWNINVSAAPVTFTAFHAKSQKNVVRLEWSTSAEINNDRFELERSSDAVNFTLFAAVKGKGSKSAGFDYLEFDKNPPATIVYYRLSQIDKDGKKSILGIRAVTLDMYGNATIVYPVPSNDYLKISGTGYSGKINFSLIDGSGKIIHSEDIMVQPTSIITIQPKTKPAPGVYVLRLKGEGVDTNFKVFFQ